MNDWIKCESAKYLARRVHECYGLALSMHGSRVGFTAACMAKLKADEVEEAHEALLATYRAQEAQAHDLPSLVV